MYTPPAPIIRTSMRVMMALPTTTNGLRARFDCFGGGGSCSGSSAARGLRGEIGGLSLIDKPEVLPVKSWLGGAAARVCDQGVYDSSANSASRWSHVVRRQFALGR